MSTITNRPTEGTQTASERTWSDAIARMEPIRSHRREKLLSAHDQRKATVTLNRHELQILITMAVNRLDRIRADQASVRREAEFWNAADLAFYLDHLEDEQAIIGRLKGRLEAAETVSND